MTEFVVRVARMETIEFLIEAEDETDAQERYLMDGEELNSQTDRLEVLNVMTHDDWEQENAPTISRNDDGTTSTRV